MSLFPKHPPPPGAALSQVVWMEAESVVVEIIRPEGKLLMQVQIKYRDSLVGSDEILRNES